MVGRAVLARRCCQPIHSGSPRRRARSDAPMGCALYLPSSKGGGRSARRRLSTNTFWFTTMSLTELDSFALPFLQRCQLLRTLPTFRVFRVFRGGAGLFPGRVAPSSGRDLSGSARNAASSRWNLPSSSRNTVSSARNLPRAGRNATSSAWNLIPIPRDNRCEW